MIKVGYSHGMIHQKIMFITCENSRNDWLCLIYLNEGSDVSNFQWNVLKTNVIFFLKKIQMSYQENNQQDDIFFPSIRE